MDETLEKVKKGKNGGDERMVRRRMQGKKSRSIKS